MNTEPGAATPDSSPLPAPPVVTVDPADQTVAPKQTGEICGNCGTPMYGEFCFHCGQPDHGLVRHFSSIMGDFLDTVLQIDTRLTRTLAPLLLRPGYLSTEYFAGRRVRYVSPVRLFFFISVLTFFFAQWSVDLSGASISDGDGDSGIRHAKTVAEVVKDRDAALKALHAAGSIAVVAATPDSAKELAKAEAQINQEAQDRIRKLEAAASPSGDEDQGSDAASPKAGPATPAASRASDKAASTAQPGSLAPRASAPAAVDAGVGTMASKRNSTSSDASDDDDSSWDPSKDPLQFSAAPAWFNRWFKDVQVRAKENAHRFNKDPKPFIDAFLGALPSTLFVLMPLFAVMLKLAYLFKRRLYMEHFIVALHSHAFLCLALLLILACNGLDAVAPHWLHTPLMITRVALIFWMPLYLLIMQKRVYRQGWIWTSIKYGVIGMAYVNLLAIGAALTMAVKLVWA